MPYDKDSSDSTDASSDKSGQSKHSEESQIDPAPRLDASRNLRECPYEADEADLKTFRKLA